MNGYAPYNHVQLHDDGQHGDGSANDGVFGGSLPAFPVHTQVFHYVEVRTGGDAITSVFEPNKAEAEPFTYVVRAVEAGESDIVINEVLAENRTAVQDPQGDYEDFIELYNTGDAAIDLSGMYLSDNNDNPRKFAFPAGTQIEARGYLVVWADENGKAKEGIHANFKLASSGEVVRLIDSDARGNALLDEVIFADQKPDRSTARFPSAKGGFRPAVPTPGEKNL